jgi:hypothetical protein
MIPYRPHTDFVVYQIFNGTLNQVLEHLFLPTSPIPNSLFKSPLISFTFLALSMHFSKIIGSYFACLSSRKGTLLLDEPTDLCGVI